MVPSTLARYARTAAYLRPDQFAHVLYRRVVPQSRPRAPRDVPRLRARTSSVAPPPENLRFGGGARIDAARRDEGATRIDWTAPGATRLERYHLHYFDFLDDRSRSLAWKRDVVADWIAANPPGTPDAWDPYPVSLRLVNWLQFFDREALAADDRALDACYAHALWLERNLEYRVRANHLLKNAKALAFAGLAFVGADADRWRRCGLDLFLAEVREQFLDDGGHYERSATYHAIGVADLLDVVNACRSAGDLVPEADVDFLVARARRGLAYFEGLLLPDGNVPLFNDAAFGIGPDPADLRAYGEATLGSQPRAEQTTFTVRSFEHSGYHVVRDGDDMLVIDCGDIGPAYQPGHGHADALSYELALGGRRVVVDRGAYGYDASARRTFVRGTAAHNTVTVDGRDQSEVWSAFRAGRRARPLGAALEVAGERAAAFSGAFVGFGDGRDAIVHRRTIRYARGTWTVADRIEGSGVRRIDDRIHLAPGLRTEPRDGAIVAYDETQRAIVRISSADVYIVSIEDTPYFPSFEDERWGRSIVFSRVATLPIDLVYTIARV